MGKMTLFKPQVCKVISGQSIGGFTVITLTVSFLMWPNKESNKNLQHHCFTTNKL